jgi:hypothetical protein
MSQQPVNKWIQSIFWPISCLPSFQHIPKHSENYVGRTSPLLGTAFAFWIAAIGAVVLALIANGVLANLAWRGIDTALSVVLLFVLVLYVAGFWLFVNREEDYPN